jgi:hypothetical protein
MLRRIIVCLIVAAAAAMAAGTADARRRQIDATPFSHAPCSVLSHHPCTPTFCSVLNRGPCIPEIDYPYGENLQLTIETVPPKDDAAKYVKPDHDLDTISDLFAPAGRRRRQTARARACRCRCVSRSSAPAR